MVKAWPESVRKLVYKHMLNIWKTRASPTWIKDKVIKLAPKIAGNTELQNMRPISLYEVVRKVWTTIIAKRINLMWHNHDILHKSQYGYKLDNGTPMPLLNVANAIEDAIHNKNSKQATFWDIRRAFDSIPRNLQRLAWTRLGVPADVAEWFVALDDKGLSFIGSPYYHHNRQLKTAEELYQNAAHHTKDPSLGFTADRGIGQGESASSLLWVAMYDILLEWIDPRNVHLHADEVSDRPFSADDIRRAIINAYADDLATITGGPRAADMQQQQAVWLSAFCALTGLVMHPAKIHATLLGPLPPGPLPTLSVYNQRWEEVACTVDALVPTIKYLGVHLDLRHDGHSQYEATLADIECRLSHLLLQAGSPQTKIAMIQSKILPVARYTAIVANWTKFPQALLYVPPHYYVRNGPTSPL